jgi:hypothetical protein
VSLNPGVSSPSRLHLLKKKVSILLGLRGGQTGSLTRAFTDANLELLTDSSPSSLMQESSYPELADLRYIEEQVLASFQSVPPTESGPERSAASWDQQFDEIDYLRDHVLSDSVLRSGVFLDRYRVASRDEGNGFPVLFRRDERELWWQIATYPSQEEAIAAVNHLRWFLARLSLESEGLHIVEHILLRPQSSSYGHALAHPEDQREFYSFKLSVFFPAWTARCSDAGFRHLAESTVRETCPAHIYPQFHWLAFSQMQLLEELHQHWLAIRSNASASPEERDAASLQLAQFIMGAGAAQLANSGESI